MPRTRRLQYEGALYHVMNRGVNKNDIFFNRYHKRLFLELLSEIVTENEIEVYGFCLMDNHYHLLLKTAKRNLSESMQRLSSLYTAKINKETRRDGPLFRGRFKSKIIHKDSYLLNVSRYIHVNPSVSGITDDDIHYSWSSYKYYASDKYRTPRWININLILAMFNYKKSSYVKYVQDEDFKKDLQGYEFCSDFPALEEIMGYLLKYFKSTRNDILYGKSIEFKRQNELLLLLIDCNQKYTKSQKAEFFNMSRNCYYGRIRKVINQLEKDNLLRIELEKLKKKLY